MTRCRVSAFAGGVKAQAGHSWVQLSRARERRDAPGGGGDGASAREAVAVRASRKRKSPRLMGFGAIRPRQSQFYALSAIHF